MSAAADSKIVSTGQTSGDAPPVLTDVAQLSDSTALTPLQQACVMRSLLSPAGGHYIQQMVCEWAEPLQINVWKQAWDFVAGRHDALRASFRCRLNGGLTQHFADAVTVSLNVMPGPSPQASRDQIVSDFLTTDRVRGFNLDSAPLWRLTVFRWTDREATTVWTFHHSLLDGRSRTLVWQEVNAVYRALLAGTGPALPPARSFREFTEWLQAAPVETAAAYWRERLQGIQMAAVLPSLSSVQDYANDNAPPAMETLTLPPAATICLREAAQRHGVTLNNLVQGSWALVLSQSQAVEEIIFGAVRSGRHWTGENPNGRVGMFINTIPFRVNTSPAQLVGDWLQGLRAQQLAARAGEHTSVEQIRHWCGLPGSAVLFRNLLVFENRDPRELLTNVSQRVRFFEKTDLPTLAANAGSSLVLNLKYSPRWHSPVQARAVLEQIRAILETLASASGDQPLGRLSIHPSTECRQFFDEWQGFSITRTKAPFQPAPDIQGNPAQSVQEKPLLTEAERHQILVEWNRTERDYPRDKCIHQLFEEQVERTPDAVAVVFEADSLTYRELNLRANRLANYLRSLGVGPEVLVGLCVERSLEVVVAILGILKAGGAYVPMDPHFPQERLSMIITDSGIKTLLTQQQLEDTLPADGIEIVCLDSGWKAIATEEQENLPSDVKVANAAYVIYTSGSTGEPKGVVISHAALGSYTAAASGTYQINSQDRILQFASFSFDASIEEIFPCLARGGTLVLRADAMAQSMSTFLDRCAVWNISVLSLPTAFWHELVLALETDGLRLPESLRLVIIGGERALPERVTQWNKLVRGSVRLVNSYGPTEATVVTTVCDLNIENAHQAPIGRPWSNVEVYILDPNSQPVPIGIGGELLIGGGQLARGYWNRSELTKEKFIPNPFKPGGRLYRTGDLARWLPDGNIEFIGRVDCQVKIRGFRVELNEIEAVLDGHSEVVACAVLAQDDGAGDKVLTAFMVGCETTAPSVASLRQWLATKLPDYMIPSRFVAVPNLPLNTNGKLDRKALAKMAGTELASGTEYVPPRSKLEQELVAIWQTVLHREGVGIRDNFFNLGGHSLLATVMVSQIHRRLGVELSLRLIFEQPTIEQLAKQLAAREGQQQNQQPIPKADRQKPLPMSFGQQGMWLLQQMSPDPATYNEPVVWRLSGRVDRKRVRLALTGIQERHEVLRTALVQTEGNLMQQIASAKDVSLPWLEVDLQGVPAGQKEDALAERLLTEVRRPFDLAQAPLWRVAWLDLAAEDQVLAFTFHHSIIDEWSSRLFFQEFGKLYATNGHSELAGLSALPVQYADYAAWRRQCLTGNHLETQRSYWREQLRDLPPALALPADKIRTLPPSGQGAVHNFQLTGPVVRALRELARQEGTTAFTVMLAAFQVWLHRCTGQKDLIVGTPAADRDRPEVQNLIGCFLNTLPIRVKLDGNRGFREVLQEVRDTLFDAFSHADLPFEQMVELAVKESEPEQRLLFRVMFVLLEEGLSPLHLDEAKSRLISAGTKTSKRDLCFNVRAVGETWNCQLWYATDLFTADSAARMARHLAETLQSIVENTHAPVSQLRLMPEAERQQILVEWNRTEQEYPRDKCIHQLFAEQVEQAPDAVAVVFEHNSLTYRELNAQAIHLAHHLRALGVGPNTLVGLRVERSPEMTVALLGILMAGGAYWALEENLPEDRIRLMLAEAQPHVLLVSRKSVKYLSTLVGKDTPVGSIRIAAIEDLLESSPKEIIAGAPPNQAGDPAYVCYTSGSTGRPKGVVVPHRGVVRLVKGANYVSLSAEETLLHLSPLSFDASTFEIWGALLNGGRVVLMPPGPPALAEIGEAIRRHGVTTLWLTAGLFHLMVDERLDDLKSLRQLLAGGDVLSPERVRKAFRALPGCRIINGYGPTENATFTCCHTVEDERALTPRVPIGRPIANTQVYVLDSHQQPVPVGVTGELYAGGDGVACGYLHQPHLTAERFVPDPFSGRPDARLYRTGDLARWRSDGNLEFLGRLDSQVKIRGFRIELGEVETVLRAQPEIREAVVVAREDSPGDKRLVAYLAAKTGDKPDVLTMRTRLAEKLPDYMVPAAFVWLDQLPLTPNGKLDRKALPAPETNDGGVPSAVSQPINLLELELIRIWRRLFRRENIDRRDNFFALGGHSLMAARLAVEIDKLFKCKLPIAALFQSPTIELLARRLTDGNWAPAWSSLVPLHPQGSKPPLFLVHGWGGDVFVFLDLARLLPPDQPIYGIQAVGLDGKSPRHISIEEMAAHYVKEIVSFQTDGPIYLAGFSMGGVIAYEMARQLHRLGRRVAMLALLDSGPTGKTPWIFYGMAMTVYIPKRCWWHFRRWWRLPFRERFNYIRGRWTALRYWMVRNRSRPPLITAAPQQTSERLEASLGTDYYHAVAHAYQFHPYPGAVDIFVSDESNPAWRLYWRHLARGGVSFHRVSGGHLQIVLSPDYMPEMAKSLTTVLVRAQEKEACAVSSRDGHSHANLVS